MRRAFFPLLEALTSLTSKSRSLIASRTTTFSLRPRTVSLAKDSRRCATTSGRASPNPSKLRTRTIATSRRLSRLSSEGQVIGPSTAVLCVLLSRSLQAGSANIKTQCTTFTFSLADHLKGKAECPWYILKEPRIFELTGAGFQKSHGSPVCPFSSLSPRPNPPRPQFYELRWARITKTCRPDPEVLTLEQLQKTATEAMQVVNDDVERRMDEIWPRKKGSARRETREEKRVREVREWVRRLERADGVAEKDGRTLGSVTNLGKGREEGRREGLAKEEPPTKRRKREVRREDAMVIWIDDPDSPVASTLTPLPGRAPVGTSTTDSSLTRRPRPHSHIAKLPHSSNSLPSSLVDIPSPSIAPSPPNHPSELPLSLQLPTPPPSSGALPLKLQTISRPPLPRTSLSLSVASLSAPPSNFFWSIYPPPTSSAPLDPRHPELDTGNYLLDPRNVLWAAGWELEGREAYRGVRRSGYVFVEEGEAEKVTKWASKRGGEETVWLIERERLDKVGLEDSVLEVL